MGLQVRRRRALATASFSADAVGMAGRNAMGGDVSKDTTDGILEHEPTKATGLDVPVDGGLHCIGDGVDHGIHERNVGNRHHVFTM